MRIVLCSCWYNCMIYARNYLTVLQSAARLQQYYCRPFIRNYEGPAWRGDCKESIFVVFDDRYFPRSLLPHHQERSQQFRDLASQYVSIITQAFHRKIPVITTPDWWLCRPSHHHHRAEWKTMLAWEGRRRIWERERESLEISWCELGLELSSDVPWPHSSYCVTH